MWLASTKLNQPQNCYQLLRPMHYPRNFGFSYIKEGKTKKKRENNPDFFFHIFLLLLKYNCLHFPPTTPLTQPSPLPALDPAPFGLVYVSFMHVENNPD